MGSGDDSEREDRGGGGRARAVFIRGLKLLIAVALIPVCIAAVSSLYPMAWGPWKAIRWSFSGPTEPFVQFLTGAIVFGAIAVFLWRPMTVYVFAHELTHALATWLCLGSVSNISASARGGSVTTSKTNFAIRLAPYVVPLYALIFAAAFFATDRWWRPLDAWRWLLPAGLGFTYAFHIGFTLHSLHREQPDLKADGWLFSMVLIFLANVELLVAVVALATEPSSVGQAMAQYNRLTLDGACQMYSSIFHAMRDVASAATRRFG